jgi:hypothetical protein
VKKCKQISLFKVPFSCTTVKNNGINNGLQTESVVVLVVVVVVVMVAEQVSKMGG